VYGCLARGLGLAAGVGREGAPPAVEALDGADVEQFPRGAGGEEPERACRSSASAPRGGVSALRVGLLACRRPDLALVHNHLKYLAFELPSIAIGLPVVALQDLTEHRLVLGV
jgi:hypothetical protein